MPYNVYRSEITFQRFLVLLLALEIRIPFDAGTHHACFLSSSLLFFSF